MALLSSRLASPCRHPWRTLRFAAALLTAAAALAPGVAPLGAQPAPAISREYQVKAVFLFNFTQFVEWPPATFPDPESPLIIGVLGNDPFGAFLDDVVRNERVNGRPLQVWRRRTVQELAGCHVLYVSASEDHHLPAILAAAGQQSALTVGDSARFMERGGMIGFFTERNRVRLRINPQVARAAGITISSKLLRPAEIVVTKVD